mmetsp:Transcript_5155/g.12136  ORF Transcript_5155/g.12136 Transcript_5155/m.12136 type:complete len:299 (+) Transcript_5155:1841-2737(+)
MSKIHVVGNKNVLVLLSRFSQISECCFEIRIILAVLQHAIQQLLVTTSFDATCQHEIKNDTHRCAFPRQATASGGGENCHPRRRSARVCASPREQQWHLSVIHVHGLQVRTSGHQRLSELVPIPARSSVCLQRNMQDAQAISVSCTCVGLAVQQRPHDSRSPHVCRAGQGSKMGCLRENCFPLRVTTLRQQQIHSFGITPGSCQMQRGQFCVSVVPNGKCWVPQVLGCRILIKKPLQFVTFCSPLFVRAASASDNPCMEFVPLSNLPISLKIAILCRLETLQPLSQARTFELRRFTWI